MTIPSLLWAPVAPSWMLLLVALAGVALILLCRRQGIATWPRLLPLSVLLLGLANPRLVEQDATPLDDIAVILVDDSPSMGIADRPQQSERALAALQERLKVLPHLQVRVEHFHPPAGRDEGTKLFAALDHALADIPRSRLAGAVLITDGQIHDIPESPDLGMPLHVLLAGHKGERDRRLVIERAPGYGIVGGTTSLSFRIEDPGQTGSAELSIRRDGGPTSVVSVPVNRSTSIDLPIEHAGPNVVELEASAAPNELTLANNRAGIAISGVRDRMRVLLISGEPHAGERTWRNLLKADPAVDLVHFTILRPPDGVDHTPLRELALISFPVRELFEEKLHDFDLIIFDRFRRRSILPAAYYRNIANYVKDGGALLMAVGPEFDGAQSPYDSSLGDILPNAPTGDIVSEPFRPQVTEVGHRHPVTADLAGQGSGPPQWGPWAGSSAANRRVPASPSWRDREESRFSPSTGSEKGAWRNC